jgi:hypothetical protein
MIVTRGFGEDGEIITRGFNVSIVAVAIAAAAAAAKALAHGGARAKKKIEEIYDEFIVRAALIAVNGEEIINPVWKTVTKAINESSDTAVKVTDFAEITVTKPTVQIFIDKIRILKD